MRILSLDLNMNKVSNAGRIWGEFYKNKNIDWVRKNADIIIAGNHDFGVVEKTDISYFNDYAIAACKWTQNKLTPKNRRFLEYIVLFRNKINYWEIKYKF